MEAAYFTAAIPEPYVIFGVKLLPLSIGRYRLLKRFGCAFVADGEAKATTGDLLLGLLICSMPGPEFIELIEGKSFQAECKRLGKRMLAEIKADPDFNLLAKFGLFKSYIEQSSHIPEYFEESHSERPSAGHWLQAMESILRAELGYTQQEIEDGPLSKAIEDYFQWAENNGHIRRVTQTELDDAQKNAAIFDAIMKKEAECRA